MNKVISSIALLAIFTAIFFGCSKTPVVPLSSTNTGSTSQNANKGPYGPLSGILDSLTPEARFTLTPVKGNLNAPAAFNFTNSSLHSDYYVWDFGDGSYDSVDKTPPTHLYEQPGTYLVSLKAVNHTKTNLKLDTIVVGRALYTSFVIDSISAGFAWDNFYCCLSTEISVNSATRWFAYSKYSYIPKGMTRDSLYVNERTLTFQGSYIVNNLQSTVNIAFYGGFNNNDSPLNHTSGHRANSGDAFLNSMQHQPPPEPSLIYGISVSELDIVGYPTAISSDDSLLTVYVAWQ